MTGTQSYTTAKIHKVSAAAKYITQNDFLAVEEPLEIRLGLNKKGKSEQKAVSITMRTPGADFELAA